MTQTPPPPPQYGGPPPTQAPGGPGQPGQPGQSGQPYGQPSFGAPQGGAPRVVPPPPPGSGPVVKAPPVGWLVPAAAVLAVIGAVLEWFRPEGSVPGRGTVKAEDGLHSWDDGKIGLLGPILLVVVGITVVGLLTSGKARGRIGNTADPVKTGAKFAMGAGAATLVCLVIAWFLVTSQYDFGNGQTWDSVSKALEAQGGSLSRGPEIGYWLTGVAGLLGIIGGVAMLMTAKSSQPARPAQPAFPAGPPAGGAPYGAPQGAPQQSGQPQYGQPPQGQPPQGGPSLQK